MARSRLGLETRAITEGALMAALTVLLALAGILIPLLDPVIMLIWALPVVVVCMRHGMRAAVATITVAGLVITMIASPLTAMDMLLRSAGPALLIGHGFRCKWKSEKTVFCAAVAASVGLVANFGLSILITGINIRDIFTLDAAFVDEMVSMWVESGLLSSAQTTPEAFAEQFTAVFTLFMYILPATLLVYGVFTAYTNFMMANVVLRRLKIPLPPVTRLATFRLPVGFLFGVMLGLGLIVLGEAFWAGVPLIVTVGQNIILVFLALYFFQGVGFISYYIGRAPANFRPMILGMLLLSVFLTFFRVIPMICYVGVADGILDFRKLDALPLEEDDGEAAYIEQHEDDNEDLEGGSGR